MNILLVEDEARVRDFIARGLRAEGHNVSEALRQGDILEHARRSELQVIVLDVLLPGTSGLEICKALRADGVMTPILLLTARDDVADKVEGLRAGADDYLTKPFHFDELLARLEALARRKGEIRMDMRQLRAGDLVLDRETFEVRRGARPLKLTTKEYAILELLLSNPGKVFSRQKILSQVWGLHEDPLTNVVDVYVARLRRQIDHDGESPLIETVRGHGYRIVRDKDG